MVAVRRLSIWTIMYIEHLHPVFGLILTKTASMLIIKGSATGHGIPSSQVTTLLRNAGYFVATVALEIQIPIMVHASELTCMLTHRKDMELWTVIRMMGRNISKVWSVGAVKRGLRKFGTSLFHQPFTPGFGAKEASLAVTLFK